MACCRRTSQRRNSGANVRVFNQNNFIPSAVELFNPTTQTLNAGEELIFLQTNYNTGASFSQRFDGMGVDIVASGVYKISFTGVASSVQTQTISLGLTLNGSLFPQSEVSQLVFTEGPQIVSASIIFKVISPSANIGVVNSGVNSFNIQNAKLDIVRIGNF